MFDWIMFVMWLAVGLINLCYPGKISKISYGCSWFVLILILLERAI